MRLILPLLLLATPAFAQEPRAPDCSIVRPAYPPSLSGWSSRRPVAAGTSAQAAGALAVGQAADLTLHPTARVTLAAAGKPPTPGSYAGLLRFEVARAGRYRVALGAGAWIDVVANGRALTSVAHGHGPVCTGIRKMVDFDLKPGRYLIQLKDAKAAALPLMVARL